MRRFAAVLAVSIVLLGTSWIQAAVQVAPGDWVVLSTGNGAVSYGDGGEFEVNVYAPGTFNTGGVPSGHPDGGYDNGGYYGHYTGNYSSQLLGSFYTFCCSTELYFVPGDAYLVGGLNPAPFKTPLGGWLFGQYWANNPIPSGGLNGYVPGHDALAGNSSIGGMQSTSVAGAIQDEIWNSLGFGYHFGLAQQAESIFGWDPSANASYPAASIDALTLIDPTGDNYGYNPPYPGVQPQLYVPSIGNGGTPEPATLILWAMFGATSWLGMRLWRRQTW